MNQEQAFRLYGIYSQAVATYGDFAFLDEDEIPNTPTSLIWTSVNVDDGGHIISGLIRDKTVSWHLKASVECELKPREIDIHEVLVFRCLDCDGVSSCGFCDQDTMVEIDFERFEALTLPLDRNVETLWAFRKPLGHEYSYAEPRSEYEELSDLISSGNMTESQITNVINEHIIHEEGCEVCDEIEFGDFNLIERIVETYSDSISNSGLTKIFDTYVESYLPAQDAWGEMYTRGWLMKVATCTNSDLSLLRAAAGDYEFYIDSYRWEEGDQSLAERTKEYAFMFAAHEDCTPEVLESLVGQFHSGGNFGRIDEETCMGKEFEACDFCQDLLQEAVAKLK
jgi:hypothetical protein